MPRVSVVTPVYNGSAFIADNIRSVMAQTYGDWEHIIVDDCSKDDTCEIIHQFPHVRLIRLEKNGGPARALNHGYRAARGEYLAWVSADDGYMPEYLENAVDYLDSHADTVCVHAGAYLVDPRGDVIRVRNMGPCPRVRPNDLLRCNPIHGASTMFRREVYHALGGFNEELIASQDTDMWIRMCALGEIGHIPKPLIFSTRHPGQDSRKRSHLVTDNQRWLADETVRRFGIEALIPSDWTGPREGPSVEAAGWYRLAMSKFGTSDNALVREWLRRAIEIEPGNLRYRLSAISAPALGAAKFRLRARAVNLAVALVTSKSKKTGRNVHQIVRARLKAHPFQQDNISDLAIA